jgi:hypothetical protein
MVLPFLSPAWVEQGSHATKKGRQGKDPSPACLTRPLAGFPYQNDPI